MTPPLRLLDRVAGALAARAHTLGAALSLDDAAQLAQAPVGAPWTGPPPRLPDALEPALPAAFARVQILTPPHIARWLAEQAILTPHAHVLDPAAGTGRLLLAAFERLIALGAAPAQALDQLHGIELDAEAAALGRASLVAAALERGHLPSAPPDLRADDALRCTLPSVDAALLNPPYANADALSAAHHLKLSAQLTFYRRQLDQSVIFLALAQQALRPAGRLAAITPRYWLEATGAADFRRWLAARAHIDALLDLGEHQLWADAQILTALLVTTSPPAPAAPRPARFARAETPQQVAPAALAAEAFEVAPERLDASPWTFQTPEAERHLRRLEDAPTRVARWLRVGQGIKTGANDLFVVSASLASALPADLHAPTVPARAIQPFALKALDGEGHLRLLLVLNGVELAQHPALLEHLTPHRARLEARFQVRTGQTRWYALSIAQNLDLLRAGLKLLCPLYARRNRFALDATGVFVRTDAYALAPRPDAPAPVPLEAIAAVLNSEPLTRFALARAKLKRDGYREYGRRLLDALPLPWDEDGRLLHGPDDLTERLAAAGRALHRGEHAADDIDDLVRRAFGAS